MQLWRISNHADLSGQGGMLGYGRWHSAGSPVVYLGENAALCMLETLVHLDLHSDEIPDHYQLLCVDVPSGVSVLSLPANYLMDGWQQNQSLTQRIGNDFLRTKKGALLKVPSVLIANQFNFLLNPLHPDAAKLTISQIQQHPYDKRLLSK